MGDNEILEKRIAFVIQMTTIYKQLDLPRDWWYTSYKKNDDIHLVDSFLENYDKIYQKLKDNHIIFKKPTRKDKIIRFIYSEK